MTRPNEQTKPKRLSYTALERYRLCPWVFYQADILKQEIPVYSRSMSLGGLLHHVIEQYHKRGPLLPMSEEELVALYHQAWVEQMPAFVFRSHAEEAATRQQGEAMLRQFYQAEQARQGVHHPVMVEASFKLDLCPGFVVTGRIDRIDQTPAGRYRVLDYKSSRRALEALERPEDSAQLALYGLACQNLTGEQPEALGLYYLAHNQILWAPYDPAAGEAMRQAFLTLAQTIEIGHFSPTPEPEKCRTCPYQPGCPAHAVGSAPK